MYGTVAKIIVKPGQLNTLKTFMSTQKKHPGSVSVFLYQLDRDPDLVYMAAIFESKEAYFANADRPEMNAEFEAMMKYLVAEPEWNDGEVVKIE
jgi:quinol monooxygenase YgiN